MIASNEDKIVQKTNRDGRVSTYSYDPMGNLTTKLESAVNAGMAQRVDYVYNYQDQLGEVKRNGETIARYGYDTKRQRIYRQVYQPGFGGSGTSSGTSGGSGGVAPGNTSFLLPEAALREAKNGRLYMWDSAGRSIGEAEATTGRIVVRYIYSGNEKICDSPELRKEQALPGFPGSVLVRLCEHAATSKNPRVDTQSGARSWYYFVNNAQGTPVLILDESGGTISRVNLDEWGNVGQLIGPASEVNYTGKKTALSQQGSGCASLCVRRILVSPLWGEHGEVNLQSPETGLYYFNQRYYDPSLGRFLTEDPAGQGLNPYAYAGNSPLMYVDPDGEWFWLAGMIIGGVIGGWGKDLSKMESWGSIAMGAAVGAMAGAGLDYVASTAGLSVNLAVELPYVGQVNLASMDFVGSGLVAAGAGSIDPYQDSGVGGDDLSDYGLPDFGPMGVPRSVFAVESGTVIDVGWQDSNNYRKGWGYNIKTGSWSDFYVYAHMDSDAVAVKKGSYVFKGQYIGQYANPTNGHSSGPHVHIGRMKDGMHVDPGSISPLLGGRKTAPFGKDVRDSMHKNGHSGVDYAY